MFLSANALYKVLKKKKCVLTVIKYFPYLVADIRNFSYTFLFNKHERLN